MKKILVLILIGFLVACEQVSVGEDSSNESVIVLEEPVIEDEPLVEEPPVVLDMNRVLVDQFNHMSYWNDVVRSETNYVDFRFIGCKSLSSDTLVPCRKYEWSVENEYYLDYNLYFEDGDVVQLTQPGNIGFQRDDDLLQVVFIGEVLGVLPVSMRQTIDEVRVSNDTSLRIDNGVLHVPNRYTYEYDATFLQSIFILLYQRDVKPFINLLELSQIVPYDVSKLYKSGDPNQALLEVVLAYYVTSKLAATVDQQLIQDLAPYFSKNGLIVLNSESSDRELVLPNHHTLYVDSGREGILISSDPSALDEIVYQGIQSRNMVDSRRGPSTAKDPQDYHVYLIRNVDDDTMEFLVNVEIDQELGEELVFEISYIHSQMPRILRQHLDFLVLQPGFGQFVLTRHGYTIHIDNYNQERFHSVVSLFIHEMGHVALDWEQSYFFDSGPDGITLQPFSPLSGEAWEQAQIKDGGFITYYAQENPLNLPHPVWRYRGPEDVADSLIFYLASRLATDRFHPKLLDIWETAVGHRFSIFDELDFSRPARGRLSQ
jgi:hypothetical protein